MEKSGSFDMRQTMNKEGEVIVFASLVCCGELHAQEEGPNELVSW